MKIFLIRGKYIGENGMYNLNVDFDLEKYILTENIQNAIKLFKINYKEYEITDVELIEKNPIIEDKTSER